MANQICFDDQMGCFFFEVSGGDAVRQCWELSELMYQHQAFKTGIPAIWDLREADLSTVNAAEAAESARNSERKKAARGRSKVALIVKGKFEYGMARVFLAYGAVEHLNFKLFYGIDEAKQWISEG